MAELHNNNIIATEMVSRKMLERNFHTRPANNADEVGENHTHHNDHTMDKMLSDFNFMDVPPPSFRGNASVPL